MNKGGCKCDKLRRPAIRERGKKYLKITHAIFDCDGTLLDSEEAYHDVLRALCKRYNKNYTMQLQEQCYGGSDHEICERVCQVLKMPVPLPQFEKELAEMCEEQLPKAKELPGVQRLLMHLVKVGVPCAVASNSTAELLKVTYLKKRPEIFKHFHHMVSVTEKEVKRGKPAPDIYLIAAQRFDEPMPTPQQCLVFEDSLTGVQAGIAAGMQVVMCPAPRIPKEKTKLATLVIPDLTHFDPELFGLPPFEEIVPVVPEKPPVGKKK